MAPASSLLYASQHTARRRRSPPWPTPRDPANQVRTVHACTCWVRCHHTAHSVGTPLAGHRSALRVQRGAHKGYSVAWQDVAMKVIIKEKCKNESQLVPSFPVGALLSSSPRTLASTLQTHTRRQPLDAPTPHFFQRLGPGRMAPVGMYPREARDPDPAAACVPNLLPGFHHTMPDTPADGLAPALLPR